MLSRRAFLISGVAAFFAACTRRRTSAPAPAALAPTPDCELDDELTPDQTEGPYFTTKSPEKADFTADTSTGTKLVLTGTVVSTSCKPIARAKLDFWQADAEGNYDNDGYKLRGHQFTDENGRYTLRTVVPGLYPGRTRHIHVKVQAPDGPVVTTQLYFPDEAANAQDGIFDDELEIEVTDTADGKSGAFTFVVRT